VLSDDERMKAAEELTGPLAKLIKMDGRLETKIKITEPGLHDVNHETYLADPVPGGSLSHSGARMLLDPHCPAYFKWWHDHPLERPKRAFELGSAAHQKLLGIGPEIVEIEALDYTVGYGGKGGQTAARQDRDDARARGAIPLLSQEMRQVEDMIDALHRAPKISKIFDPDHGKPEQSFFWLDPSTKIMRRCRVDWLPEAVGGRVILVDYKTTKSAHPDMFAKDVINYDYEMAAQSYCEGVSIVLDVETTFLFIAQEKTPPYLVSAIELSPDHYKRGQRRNRTAVDLYAECRKRDYWPSYTDEEPYMIELPPWAQV